ncbi:hypothetical protein H5J22_03725 [Cetobacterium sp. 8H]|uniref:tetratricopeptide repeat protein n=1 Tax=Cetobacterium sp. 8H TaxID=2759681 RepID=UPI00163C3DB8|nr:hypothetical protein [Cetobacterium sp. 8H]MBC2850551.1 hypothetical protein [Cetobacterium sp. 8H]
MWIYLFLMLSLVGCNNLDRSEKSNEKYLVLKGANLYSSGKKSEALKMYSNALKLNPQNLVALREKGIILAQLGDLKLGQENLEKVLKANPNDTIVLKNLAYISFKKKDYSKSFNYLEKIPTDLKSNQDYLMLGYIFYLKKDYVKSLKKYSLITNNIIYSDSIFFDSYLKVLEDQYNKTIQIQILLLVEDKIVYSKTNTLILFEYYKNNLKEYKLAERVMKNYLTYNNLNNEILKKLSKLYDEIGEKEESLKTLNLIS